MNGIVDGGVPPSQIIVVLICKHSSDGALLSCFVRSHLADPPEIISQKVSDHEVLCPVLLAGFEVSSSSCVCLRIIVDSRGSSLGNSAPLVSDDDDCIQC